MSKKDIHLNYDPVKFNCKIIISRQNAYESVLIS